MALAAPVVPAAFTVAPLLAHPPTSLSAFRQPAVATAAPDAVAAGRQQAATAAEISNLVDAAYSDVCAVRTAGERLLEALADAASITPSELEQQVRTGAGINKFYVPMAIGSTVVIVDALRIMHVESAAQAALHAANFVRCSVTRQAAALRRDEPVRQCCWHCDICCEELERAQQTADPLTSCYAGSWTAEQHRAGSAADAAAVGTAAGDGGSPGWCLKH